MRRVRLPGGLRLVEAPRPGSPLAAVVLRVRVGSGDERPDERGTAHMLEHLVVRCALAGGRVGEGALVSARTGRESTAYSVVVRAFDAVRAVVALGAVFDELRVPPDVLAAEQAAIVEEAARRHAEPAWRIRESLLGGLWAGTAFEHPVLGDARVVASLTPRRVLRFHRTWYHPANATLVVVAGRPLPDVAAVASRWTGAPAPPHRTDAPSRPWTATAGRDHAGIAFAYHRVDPAGSAAPVMLAREAVAAASGVQVRTLPLGEWLCVWAATAREPFIAALTRTRDRLTSADGAAWLRTEALIPTLRREDDVETAAVRAADPRTLVTTDALLSCAPEPVAAVLTHWRNTITSGREGRG
ncbi:M16 family metallopeptidase [Actinomadura decatromicini]|uniref:Insulinase family protein n=1 Tax=Actinomadura decatromicini TaxID=2604572 RepID=A0A5D3FS98_9ACTN|nr:insulinase family protein [Actinomadura decatromicini]TYK50610.1 insulinase family protein [Actinomadura decatromicini]